jgi:UDP-N-acetylmuramate dehydrogenase
LARKIKIDGPLRTGEPLREHTSFRIGGPADLYAAPGTIDELVELHTRCRDSEVPCFILGGGSNVLVSDRGIRGMVIDLSRLRGSERAGSSVNALCGTPMSEVSERALQEVLSGLEFSYRLPGSVGGAVWMNARCYESSMSDALEYVTIMTIGGEIRRHDMVASEWDYKKSPFQSSGEVIVQARFRLQPGDPAQIEARMRENSLDREKKGHFLYPSVGSIFKNNRAFGAPTGKLIDSLGLKGRRIGDAQIAPFHGNIIINLGNATATDVLSLVRLVEREIEGKLGLKLEREVVLAGEW